jgi:hypothetical protein
VRREHYLTCYFTRFFTASSSRRGAFGLQGHHIGLACARDDEAQASEFRVTLADLGDVLGPHEYALDLGSWSVRPIQPLMRMLLRPHGLTPGSAAVRSPRARRIGGSTDDEGQATSRRSRRRRIRPPDRRCRGARYPGSGLHWRPSSRNGGRPLVLLRLTRA